MIYTCAEHLDVVIDEVLEDEGKLPLMERLDKTLHSCHYCDSPAIYEIKKSDVTINWE